MPGEAPPPYEENNKPPAAGFHVPQQSGQLLYPTQPPYPTQPMPAPQTVHITSQPGNVVVVQPTATRHVFVHEILPPVPTLATCSSCHHSITTRVDYKPGTRTHMWALIMCLFGCWPCCLLPYCMHSCQNANHFCPRCGAFIGTAL